MVGDSCTFDVADRVKQSRVELSLAELGELLGCSKQSAWSTLQRAAVKWGRAMKRFGEI